MSIYGIQESGFVIKPLDVIISEMEASERANIADDIDVSYDQVFGQINAIVGAEIREAWEALQDVYASQYPDDSVGVPLDNVCAYTGTVRLPQAKSTVPISLMLDAGTTVPAGSVVAEDLGGGTPSTVNRFVTVEDVTNGGGSPASVDTTAEGEDYGPLDVVAGAMVIVTPVTGWTSVTATEDATVGRLDESDDELRLRREQDLRAQGSSAVDSIRGDLRALSGVTSAHVYENTDDVTDGDGRPPHTFECVVLGGDDQEIADLVWAEKPAGIATYGTTTQSVTDSSGETRSVSFSRPTGIPIYLKIDIEVGAAYPSDGDDTIKEALATWGAANLSGGDEVVMSLISAQVMTALDDSSTVQSKRKVRKCTAVRIDTVGPAVIEDDYATGAREIAQLDASRIVLVHV